MGEQIKVAYRTREGYETTAYVDSETGVGTNKHSDIDVIVSWSDEEQIWVQVDTWEWTYNGRKDEFERVFVNDSE